MITLTIYLIFVLVGLMLKLMFLPFILLFRLLQFLACVIGIGSTKIF